MARPVTITISHEIGREEAQRRIREGFEKVADNIGFGSKFEQRWEGETLHFNAQAMGMSATGSVEVAETTATITVMLPGLLAGMAEMIKGKVEKESTLLLEKKK